MNPSSFLVFIWLCIFSLILKPIFCLFTVKYCNIAICCNTVKCNMQCRLDPYCFTPHVLVCESVLCVCICVYVCACACVCVQCYAHSIYEESLEGANFGEMAKKTSLAEQTLAVS